MNLDQSAYNQIAKTLSVHFDSLHYIDLETGEYREFFSTRLFSKLEIPTEGDDFFAMAKENNEKLVHPDDLDKFLSFHDRSTLRDRLKPGHPISVSGVLASNGAKQHTRHIFILCEDEKHMIFCTENTEEEFLEREEHKKNLESAERMARRDELTGIRNKNAFAEFTTKLDEKIERGDDDLQFAVVMGDVNDLKIINDTRGHSFGDEVIQRASRMICEIYKHSPVFRIGGDEFVVIIMGEDYEKRDILLNTLREESALNGRTKSGPVVACGMSIYEQGGDADFTSVFKRADKEMYDNKTEIKNRKLVFEVNQAHKTEVPFPDDRKRALDKLFGALITVSGGGYVYLNDLKFDYSRWSIALVDDFGMESEYMYHAGVEWQRFIHPDDLKKYDEAVEAAVCGEGELRAITYRARLRTGEYVALHTRGFIIHDADGRPEYFGGIIVPR